MHLIERIENLLHEAEVPPEKLELAFVALELVIKPILDGRPMREVISGACFVMNAAEEVRLALGEPSNLPGY